MNLVTNRTILRTMSEGERIKAGLEARRERGERVTGSVPYGYTLHSDGVHLEENPEEQAIITIVRQFAEENPSYSTRQIAKWLDEGEVKSRSGKPWHHMQIERMLKR